MTGRQTAMLLALAALWGGSFLFNAVAVDAFGPIGLALARTALAAVVLAALVPSAVAPARGRGKQYVVLGGLGVALPFALICTAQLTLPASMAAILNASTPLWAALVGAAWFGQRLTWAAAGGLLVGVAGVALVVGFAPMDVDLGFLLAAAASLGAALCYGLGSHAITRWFAGEPPAALSLGQLAGAAIVLTPVLPAGMGGSEPIGLEHIGALVALAVLCTSVAYLLFFRLIAETGATKALTVTLLVPVFGAAWSVLLLGESLTVSQLVGTALVLGSVRLVAGSRSLQQRDAREQQGHAATAPAGQRALGEA